MNIDSLHFFDTSLYSIRGVQVFSYKSYTFLLDSYQGFLVFMQIIIFLFQIPVFIAGM